MCVVIRCQCGMRCNENLITSNPDHFSVTQGCFILIKTLWLVGNLLLKTHFVCCSCAVIRAAEIKRKGIKIKLV